MELVLDANIVFSARIKEEYIRRLILLSDHSFFVPEFILEEMNKHKALILEKANVTEEELKEIFNLIIKNANIEIIPREDFEDYIKEAEEISYDMDDVHYLALALKLKCPIWSNDNDFKKQDKVKVFSTSGLLKELKN
ncbi:MAG: PIN domain-containing protein [Nanoarchaeota archaeon]